MDLYAIFDGTISHFTMKSIKSTPLAEAIAKQCTRPGIRFVPDANFYNAVMINRKRFAALVRGEAEMTLREAITLGSYFSVEPTALLPKQLSEAYSEPV